MPLPSSHMASADVSLFPAQETPNNFKLLRLITALVVAATHSLWVVYGLEPPKDWWLSVLMQMSHCGICIFFGLSGYLITASLLERPNMMRYITSRILRLCPLILLASIVLAFVVGPLVSDVSFGEYYGSWRVWAYVPLTTMVYPDMTLPGVFTRAPAAEEVNISIWTLRYEVIAYIAMGIAAGLGILHSRYLWLWAGLAVVGYCVLTFGTELREDIAFLKHGVRFGLAFIMGLLLFRYRDEITLNFFGVTGVIGMAVLTNDTMFVEPFRILALTYTTIWFGQLSSGFLSSFNKLGDYSYGIFVFHWPIAQIVLQYNPEISYGQLLTFVLPLSLLFAMVSWHGVEAPLLNSRTFFANVLREQLSRLSQFGAEAVEVMATYHEADRDGVPSRNARRSSRKSRRHALQIGRPHRPSSSSYPHDSRYRR